MSRFLLRPSLLGLLAAVVGVLPVSDAAIAGEPVLEGYADYDVFRAQVKSIAASEFATLQSLGRTRGGREVYLLAIGAGNSDRLNAKPAVLVVGSVHPPHLAGSELATRLARRLVEEAESKGPVRAMLDRVTFYVIPRPAPDACEAFFRRPHFERAGNERPTDDDRDGRFDEDPPDDLDGDGLITMLRVEDASGPYVPHPDDGRVMIEADPKQHERGRYSLYVEGRDDDRDDALNEDPPGGVAFNRNFTFRYPYFKPGAGPHQVSEVETRAVADFAFSHPNIAAVLCFTPEDNLVEPWEPDASAEKAKIKTTLLVADAPYFNHVAEAYREILDRKDAPDSPEAGGSFSEWAYFHYGRWSFACRGWWPPEVETKQDQDDEGEDDHDDYDEDDDEDDEPGEHDLNALRFFAKEKIDGFVDWKPIAHPDLPGRNVEVGGFKPFLRLNPPAGRLEPLADKHWQFLSKLVELLPRVVIREAKAEPLGRNVWRVTAVVSNEGHLPTVSEMGRITGEPHPLQIRLELPKGVSLVSGHARAELPPLAGEGGRTERTWLVALAESVQGDNPLFRGRGQSPGPASLRVRVWSPSVGTTVRRVELTGQQPAGREPAGRKEEE